MADERSKPPYNQESPVPARYARPGLAPSLTLPRKRGRGFSWGHTLEQLGSQKGLLELIFNKAQNKFQDPARLRRVRYNAVLQLGDHTE